MTPDTMKTKPDPAEVAYQELQVLSQLRQIQQTEDRGSSEIQRMFHGATIFITGGTGFLGKQLLEKLLRSCRGIKRIYLLSRSKKGVAMEDRLKTTLTDPVFNTLRKKVPDFEKLLSLVEGDVTKLRLGLSDDDWNKLVEEVNFLIHEAATVKFDEPLKVATITNVRGTREIMRLAKECKNLKSFVYVSTAYTTSNMPSASEKFYPTPITGELLIELAETLDSVILEKMKDKLIKGWPNTYTFSKAVAENMVASLGQGLPVGIVRPAIVSPSACEPTPGWLDISNCFGPSGLTIAGGIGIVKTVYVDKHINVPLVPVDYVNNLTIATSWDTANRFQNGDQEIKIHTMSNIRHLNTWEMMRSFFAKKCRQFHSPKTVWYCAAVETKNSYLFLLYTVLFHLVPAFFIDIGLKIAGKNFSALNAYKKAYKLNKTLGFFITKSFEFYDDNALRLTEKMSDADKTIFNFDMTQLNYEDFMNTWWFGLRKYILKDELKGTEDAVKRQPYLRILHYIATALYAFVLWKVLCLAYSFISSIAGWIFTLGC